MESKIEWTKYTFNPWWGCKKVTPEFKNCNAKYLSDRFGFEGLWDGEYRFFGDKHMSEPFRWDRAAVRNNRREQKMKCGLPSNGK